MSEHDSSSFFEGLLIGGAVGFVASLFLAQASGRETRQKIQENAGETVLWGARLLEEGMGRLASAVEEGNRTAAQKREELNGHGH